MKETLETLNHLVTSPTFWIVTVILNILINVVSKYAGIGIEHFFSKTWGWASNMSEKARTRNIALVESLKADPELRMMTHSTSLAYMTISAILSTAAVLSIMLSFIVANLPTTLGQLPKTSSLITSVLSLFIMAAANYFASRAFQLQMACKKARRDGNRD